MAFFLIVFRSLRSFTFLKMFKFQDVRVVSYFSRPQDASVRFAWIRLLEN